MGQILGTPVANLKSGGSYTPETSSNPRKVIALVTFEGAGGGSNSAVALGGNAFAFRGRVEASGIGESGSIAYAEAWELPEASIPVGASTLSITSDDGDTAILYTVEVADDATLTFFSDKDVESNLLTVDVPVVNGDILLAIGMDVYTGRTFTWTGLTERMDGGSGGYGDWVYSAADAVATTAETRNIVCDSSGGDNTASAALGVIHISEGSGETLALDQTSATHGDVITGTSSILDATSALIKDGSDNTLALVNFTNLTGGDYSFKVPDLTPLLVSVIPGACTIELTNGTDTAIDTIDLVPIAGYSQIIATTQDAGLTEASWGYVGSGGLDAAATPGDVLWAPVIPGLTFQPGGDLAIDPTYTGGQATFWLLDADDSLTWSTVTMTLQAESSDTTAPILTTPTGTATGSSTATGTVTTDEAGTLYVLIDTSPTAIESAIRAGGSQAATAGVNNVSANGLSPDTQYYWHFVEEDASGNVSNIVHSAAFTTDALPVDTTPDTPDLGANVTNAEPGSSIVRTFVVSGVDQAITWNATDDAEISLNGSSYGAAVNAGNGQTIYVRIQSSTTYLGVATAGISGNGVTASFTVTTRAQLPPVLAATAGYNGSVDQAFSQQLQQTGGEPASTWSITGGADQAQYALDNSGVLSRIAANDIAENEVIQVTASNSGGTSGTQTITITYVGIQVSNGMGSNGVRSIGINTFTIGF